MTKVQKVWLGVFLAMFIVPEVVFGGLISTFFGNQSPLPIVHPSIFIDKVLFLGYLMFLSEIFGIAGLLVISRRIQYKNLLLKYLFISTLVLILLIQILIAYAYYRFTNTSFP